MKKKFMLVMALMIFIASNAEAKKNEEIIELHPEKVAVADQTVPAAFYDPKKRTLYRLRGGDQLNIRVHGYEELSSPDNGTSPYTIRPDGKFYLPLIGEIDALGRTVPDICQEIETRYAKYLRSPKVDINIMKIRKIQVCILGQVVKQGIYDFEREPTLIEAISAAWGFNEKSAKKKVFVIRAGEEEPCLKIDIRKFLKGQTTGHNILLNEGDCVYITSNHKIHFLKDIQPILSSIYYVNRIE